MFSSSILFLWVALLLPSTSALTLAHVPRVVPEGQVLAAPLADDGGSNSICQGSCSSLAFSLKTDTSFTISLLCSSGMISQATSCYSCLANNGFSISKLQAAGDDFVANCADDGFT
ncbi:hypothetical protein B0H19DRAFT_1377051 [Mycena capillaripes]|nr:hypothetical protein B0H19DRAFT_1377051 [Mycena capillaripes]